MWGKVKEHTSLWGPLTYVVMSTCNGFKGSDGYLVPTALAMRGFLHPFAVESQCRMHKNRTERNKLGHCCSPLEYQKAV